MSSYDPSQAFYPVSGTVTVVKHTAQRRNSMSNEHQIYSKRLIQEECILINDDIIFEQN